jgi:NTP pyrophosphatase (non-canonical NTP hydrolase)
MKIITQKELASLAEDAFKNADKHGFYTESTEIETELMLIITEMAEAVQADRHNRHGSIEDYESEIQMGRDIPTAYKNSLEGTVESEFADIAIRILSLLGWMNSKTPIKLKRDSSLADKYEVAKIQYKVQNTINKSNIAKDLYRLNGHFSRFVDNESCSWFVSDTLQDILMRVFAIAHNNNIDLMEHIKLKMKYNESRPYLHGCKY